MRALMMRVARVGRVYRVAHDHYFLRGAVADLAALLSELCGIDADGSVMAAAFRDRIGVGRKLAIQILEFFDRTGLTRRVRDAHRLRNGTLEF
jgi:selenocysteine-specific elongation factor